MYAQPICLRECVGLCAEDNVFVVIYMHGCVCKYLFFSNNTFFTPYLSLPGLLHIASHSNAGRVSASGAEWQRRADYT